LVQLAGWKDDFAEIGVNVAAMSYDGVEVLAAFDAKHGLGYPLLQDVGVKHVNAYGIRNMEYEPGDGGYGVPEPGILFISPEGKVLLKFAVPGYRQRPPFDELLRAITSLDRAP
jgi:peroxiredoxin